MFSFQGAVSRLMTGGSEDGKFLIRNNTECHGYHVLSLLLDKQPFHFKIQSRVSMDYVLTWMSGFLEILENLESIQNLENFIENLEFAWKKVEKTAGI